MEKRNIIIRFSYNPRSALLLLAFLFLSWHPAILNSEQLTMTTYYPAPFGGYVQILTTGNAVLARDSGAVCVGGACGSPMTVGGNNQNVKLDIRGKAMSMDDGGTIHSRGRMHIDGEETLYLLNQNGVNISKLWGGTGSLTVEGAVHVQDSLYGFCEHRYFAYDSATYCGGSAAESVKYTIVSRGDNSNRDYGLNMILFGGYYWNGVITASPTSGYMICCKMRN
jgi:hypothetical protein